jgi:hypothetical protein
VKTALPAPEEYYRLTRARELRRKADRVARWCWWGLPLLWLTSALLLVPTAALLGGLEGAVAAAFSAVGGWMVVNAFWLTLPQRITQLRSEAAALEAEHQASYGELPAGEGS